MTRPFLLVAGVGLLTSVGCFAIAAAIGPMPWRQLAEHHDGGGGRGPAVDGGGPQVTREIAWTGGDEFGIRIPANVTYTQGSPARLVITGPQGTVSQVRLDDGALRFDRRVRDAGRVQVDLTAPHVDEFRLMGSQSLRIEAYDRPSLEVQMAGSGDVVARGRTTELSIHIAGSGDADMAGLAARDAEINIAGSGDAQLHAIGEVEVHIAGSGDVALTVPPANIETHIAGSGRVTQPPPAPLPAAPGPPPAPL